MSTKELLLTLWYPVYEGEEGGDTPPAGDNPPAGDPPPPKDDKTPKGEYEKLQKANKKLLEEFNALRQKVKLTAEERETLDKKINDLESQMLTKEELAAKEKTKLEKKFTQEIEKLSTERETWKTRYTESTVLRAITDAAVSNNAVNPKQIVALMRNMTTLNEELDEENKPNGNFIPRVKFPDTGKDGKPVVLDLSVDEAVKRMKELDEYMNLFKSEGTGGIGGTTRSKAGTLDIKELAKDPAKYREARKKGLI